MARLPFRLPLAASLLLLLATPALAVPIDFETIPGDVPSEGLLITDQFQATLGVTFELEGGGSPRLAATGSPMTAFGGGPTNEHDEPAAAVAAQIGQYFLTDDGAVGAPPAALVIRYDTPVSAAGGILLDVDGWDAIYEAFRIEARDDGDAVLETIELLGTIAGDGQVAPWSFDRGLADIYSLRISYFGNKAMGIGFGLDWFSPSSPYEAPLPEPGAAALLALGAGLLAARRRG